MSSEKDIEKGIPWLLIIFMSIVAMLVTSYITGILITWPKQLVGYTSADANSWLQFWGSMLGGFIGTLAVIYVAHLQSNEQIRLLNLQIKKQQTIEDINLFLKEIQSFEDKLSEYYFHCVKMINLLDGRDYTSKDVEDIKDKLLSSQYLYHELITKKITLSKYIDILLKDSNLKIPTINNNINDIFSEMLLGNGQKFTDNVLEDKAKEFKENNKEVYKTITQLKYLVINKKTEFNL